MKIEILGTGCPKCVKLLENTKKAVDETGIQAEVVKVSEILDIINYGIMTTPALVINGKVKIAGKVPTVDEIKKMLNE